MQHQRNDTLDMIKLFASYMVVFIHVKFFGEFGLAIAALARFAVPLFFLVSGFYSYKITTEKVKKRIAHIFCLLIFAEGIYCLYDVLSLLLKQTPQEIIPYLYQYVKPIKLLKLLVINAPIHTVHLWYLWAILYVYVILYFVVKWKIPDKLVFIVSLLALLLHLFLGEFLLAFKVDLSSAFVRNFALTGIPFFGLGMLAKKYSQKLCAIPAYVIVGCAIFGIAEVLLSWFFWGKNELYLGSLGILFSLTAIFVKYPNIKYPSILNSLTGCSTYIYILHLMVSGIMGKVYAVAGLDMSSSVILKMIHPFAVCIFSTVTAYIFVRIERRLKKNA